jgi:hypothetical protein
MVKPKRSTRSSLGKLQRNSHNTIGYDRTTSDGFQGYRIVRDTSWLRDDETFDDANRIMQKSISSTGHISGVPCLWLDDLKAEFHKSNACRPPLNLDHQRERTCNSFLQYRILVQRCFQGQQTDISKEVEALWRNESKEMQFYCHRNSEIETCIYLLVRSNPRFTSQTFRSQYRS